MDVILEALSYLGDPLYWGVFFAGTLLSAAVGLIPGVGSLLVMALILPFLIFTIDDPAIAIVMLAAITGSSNTLDSLPAVLIGMPSGGVQVTFLEGHQLARRGQGAYAMGAVYAVSALGGIVGAIALAIVIPVIRPFVLSFNYPEIAAMAAFGMAMVAVLSRGAMLKGFIGTMLGILMGTLGIDALTGEQRFTFGQSVLWQGLPTVATLLGIFALPELIDLSMTRAAVAPEGANVSVREVFRGARAGIRTWKTVIRQALFGVFMGAIPGVGSSVVEWLAYSFGIVFSKDKTQFGKGSLEGLLFAESAQNAKEGGQAIPTLTLGIPGGTGWIMIIVALLAFGIAPGVDMVGSYAHVTMLIVITLALGNLVLTMIAMVATGYMAKLTQIPYPVIGFTIIPIAMLSGFLDLLNWMAFPIMFAFTIVGLVMKRYQWPRPPLVLGFILGPIMDRNLQSAVSIMGIGGVAQRPLTVILFATAIILGIVMYRMMGRSEATAAEAAETAPPPAPVAGGAVDKVPMQWRLTFRAEQLVTIATLAVAIAAIVASWDYAPRSRALPVALSIGVLIVGTVLLLRQMLTREVKKTEIFDLGMRSSGLADAMKTGLIIFGLFVLFTVVSMLIGLRWGAVAMAFVGPLVLMERRRLLSAVVGGAVVWLFTRILMDWLINVHWPQPVLGNWFLGLF